MSPRVISVLFVNPFEIFESLHVVIVNLRVVFVTGREVFVNLRVVFDCHSSEYFGKKLSI